MDSLRIIIIIFKQTLLIGKSFFFNKKILYLGSRAPGPGTVGAGGTFFIRQDGATHRTGNGVQILFVDGYFADMRFEGMGNGIGNRLN